MEFTFCRRVHGAEFRLLVKYIGQYLLLWEIPASKYRYFPENTAERILAKVYFYQWEKRLYSVSKLHHYKSTANHSSLESF